MKKKIHLIICLLLISNLALVAQNKDDFSGIILLSPGNGSFSINTSVYYFEDPESRLTFQEISKPEFSDRFVLSSSSKFNFGFTHSSYWVKFCIRNAEPELNDWFLEIEYVHFDTIDFYNIDGNNTITLKRLGDRYPFRQRELYYRTFVIPLNQPDTLEQTYFIRFRTEGSMQLAMNIHREKVFFKKAITTETYYGIFFGVMLALLLYNLIVYFSLKDIAYLHFVILILTNTIFQGVLSGHIFQYLLGNSMWLNNNLIPTTIFLAEFCMILFARSFLNTRKYSAGLHLILNFALYLALISMLTIFIFGYNTSAQIATRISLLYILLCILSGIICMIKGNRAAGIYILAFIVYLIGALAMSLMTIGMLPRNILTAHGMEIGSMLNWIFLSLALANSYKLSIIEKNKTQEEILHIREKAAEMLEQKVQERTWEIQEKNEELKQQQEELKTVNDILENQKEELQQTLENLKLAQTQLVQSEKMASVGQLVAGIAHEINNPINYISAGVDSLYTNLEEIRQVLQVYHKINAGNVKEKLKEIEELKQKVEYKEALREIDKLIGSIRNGTKRTTEIVRGLRTFSHLDEDIFKMTDIHEGIDTTLILLHNKYMNRIEIIKNYGDIPLIEGNPGQLNQVFMNILSNAVDAIEGKGKIIINTYVLGENIRISIKDSGHGIPENIIEKIFDPFFTTKGVGKGTGLGLSISQSIIGKHKGRIEVISKPGKGTEFIISLPIVQHDK